MYNMGEAITGHCLGFWCCKQSGKGSEKSYKIVLGAGKVAFARAPPCIQRLQGKVKKWSVIISVGCFDPLPLPSPDSKHAPGSAGSSGPDRSLGRAALLKSWDETCHTWVLFPALPGLLDDLGRVTAALGSHR